MDQSKIIRISEARWLAGHTLELRFGDGYVGQIDFSPALWGPVFKPLTDEDYFSRFHLEDDTIRWPNDADFCPEVLRYWCEAGGVQSQEKTDAHFAKQSASSA